MSTNSSGWQLSPEFSSYEEGVLIVCFCKQKIPLEKEKKKKARGNPWFYACDGVPRRAALGSAFWGRWEGHRFKRAHIK